MPDGRSMNYRHRGLLISLNQCIELPTHIRISNSWLALYISFWCKGEVLSTFSSKERVQRLQARLVSALSVGREVVDCRSGCYCKFRQQQVTYKRLKCLVRFFQIASISRVTLDPTKMLRLIPAPMASSPQPGVGFSFALAPAPNASMSISASAGTSRTPSMVANDQPAGPITPVRRFPESTMGMFHGRAMDDGEPNMRIFKCLRCGIPIMEGQRSEHSGKKKAPKGNRRIETDCVTYIALCAKVAKELEIVSQGLSLKLTGKKAQKGGLKRNGSESESVDPYI